MKQIDLIKRYIKDNQDIDITETGYPFVTVSREAGAGGHSLAREIMKELDKWQDQEWAQDWEVFDYKLCLLIIQDNKLNASFESLMTEEYRSGIHQAIYEMLVGKTEQYNLQKRIFEIIRILATIGRVIIVGRAAAFVTQDMETGIRMRIVGSEALRLKNMMKLLEKDKAETLKIMRKQDADRAKLVKDFFNRDLRDPQAYDVVWNADRFSQEEIARVTADMLVKKAALRKKPRLI